MFQDFKRELVEYQRVNQEKAREIRQLQEWEANRQKALTIEAKYLSSSIYGDIGRILTGRKEESDEDILARYRDIDYRSSFDLPDPNKPEKYWTLTQPVILEEPRAHEVTILARGNETPLTASKSFVIIAGFPSYLEVNENFGLFWTKEQRGHLIKLNRQIANPVEARFYRNVLNKFMLS